MVTDTALQADLDVRLAHYNGERTSLKTLIAGKEAWKEMVDNLN